MFNKEIDLNQLFLNKKKQYSIISYNRIHKLKTTNLTFD